MMCSHPGLVGPDHLFIYIWLVLARVLQKMICSHPGLVGPDHLFKVAHAGCCHGQGKDGGAKILIGGEINNSAPKISFIPGGKEG